MIVLDTILIVEDNPGDFLLLKEYILLAGITVKSIVPAKTLQEMRSMESLYPPDLIFLDLNLPDANGLETFLTTNAVFFDTPIIVLSGMHDTSIALQAIQAGAQDYLVKGEFDEKILLKAIGYSVERKKNQLKLQESNRMYEMVSKATNDPLFDWNIYNDEIKWNDRVNIFGYPASVRKNAPWAVANIHPDDIFAVRNHAINCITDPECAQWSDKFRFLCFDGSYKHLLARGYIIRNKKKKAIRIIGAIQDITHEMIMQKKLAQEKESQQKALLKATIEGQEKERSDIGKELHDNINQILASIKLMIGLALSGEHNDKKMLQECIRLTEDCIREIRNLSSSFVPLKEQEIELVEAVNLVIQRLKKTSGIQYILAIEEELAKELNDVEQLTIYRIIQEQLNNIIKHAKAAHVTISLYQESDNVILTIKDDGVGFEDHGTSDGIGLKNMKSRAQMLDGTFFIYSSPGAGTELIITLPVFSKQHEDAQEE